MRKNRLILISVLIIASFLRLLNLANIPPHPSLDEVSIGYNAFSILKTGADEFGEEFPILLRAYDDYRPAHYTYIVVPFVKFIGLNIMAVRLPSALLSILTVLSVYLLVIGMFSKIKQKHTVALIAAFLLSISPWHIYLSRLGHEVNLFFSSFIFAMTFFYWYLDKGKTLFLIGSSVFFALSFSAYQSGKIFIPVILVSLIILYHKVLLKQKVLLVFCTILFLFICTPVIIKSLEPKALIRFDATNIYSEAEPYLKRSAEKVLEAKENDDLLGQLLNNRRLVYIGLPVNAYISHLNPVWLFTGTHNESFKSPNIGLLFFFELPLILIGIYSLFFLKVVDIRVRILLTMWFLASILPGAITNGYPHAMRIYQILPVPQILGALGIMYTFSKYRKVGFVVIVALIILGASNLIYSYFIQFPRQNAIQFQYGITDAFTFVKNEENNYKRIYISNKAGLFQSYMFYLFSQQIDPREYQHIGGTISGGFSEEHVIGKYYFKDVMDIKDSNVLIIANPNEIPNGELLKIIYLPDGKEAIWILKR